MIYNQNLPRIAYLHIYKLVYSSDLDYKVRKEIVKMIVVQNRTFSPFQESFPLFLQSSKSTASHVWSWRRQFWWNLRFGL